MNIMCSQFVKNVFFHKYEQLEASDQDNQVVIVQTDSVTLLNISTDINRLCLFVFVSVSSGNQRPLSSLTYWFSYNSGHDDIQEVCSPALRETSVSLYPGVWLRLGQNHQ